MIDTRLAPYGIFLLRVALGAMFIAHALLKYLVFTMPGFEGFLGKIGLPAALAWPIVLAELVGGAAIVAGFYGRWVSLVLLPVLAGALFVHAGNGWLFTATGGGWEYPGIPRSRGRDPRPGRRRRLRAPPGRPARPVAGPFAAGGLTSNRLHALTAASLRAPPLPLPPWRKAAARFQGRLVAETAAKLKG